MSVDKGTGERTSDRSSDRNKVTRGRKVPELIARQIVDEIVANDLGPGDILPSETAMLERYEVGRSSLREGLLFLEILGIIARKPGRKGGPVVGAVSAHDFGNIATLYFRLAGITYRELIEARLLLQPISARMAAERRDAELLAKLRELMAASADVDLGDDEAYLDLILDFQVAVASVSGNPVIALFARVLGDVYANRLIEAIAPASRRSAVVKVHLGIAEAILAGDGELAAELAGKHAESTMRRLSKSLAGIIDDVIEWH